MLDLSKNHFELFGIPVGFDLDLEDLARRYRDLQRVVHPDRFVNATERERRLSMQGATRINEAYGILIDPLARGRYLLVLQGLDMDGVAETTRDTDFLMQQMALREELEVVKRAVDPFAAVNSLMSRIDGEIERLTGQMAEQFAEGSQDQLNQAREIVHKMQFLKKLRSEAEAVEAELDETLE